ncbi:formyltransferase [Candidatus Vallotia cooleyia]|uniref:formyltransferase n=1 Tax=Candidatus Vallotiella adelgis TaxID=1177211 RepID=UPI001D00E1BF|nr:formyltransferase [Candidatus Vallotia cooleyia]
MNARAVVFAYHNIGARCLRVLLAGSVDIALIVTQQNNPKERIWFESVAAVAEDHGLLVITPADPNSPELIEAVRMARPDFLFSFYYRYMLSADILALAPRGTFNLHGSLLPKYRGRVPINWAVLNGETETGVTLHTMTAKPDAGEIIAQTSVPILPDDTAVQVFNKVTVAAEQTLWRILPALLAGQAPQLPNDLAAGSYFGRRRPEDGRIDWSLPAQKVYNLVRAVAPPYPGAFTDDGDERFIIAAARLARHDVVITEKFMPGLRVFNNALLGVCGDGRALAISELRHVRRDASYPGYGERVIDAAAFLRLTQSLSNS